MVGFNQYQSMNQMICALKGTTDGNLGDICVLAVGDLYQLPPVGQCQLHCCVMQICYIDDYSVFSVSTAMIAYTKEQCLTPTYFPYFLASLL